MSRAAVNILLLFALPLMAAACLDGNEDANASTGATGLAPCTETHGILQGDLYMWALPGDPMSVPAANAFVTLRQTTQEQPILADSDDKGHFFIPLEAGTWLVGAQDSSGCTTMAEETIELEECMSMTKDMLIEACYDG